MAETFRDFWEQRVAATPDAPFLIYGKSQRTFAEFDASLNSLANGLAAAGLRRGDHLAYHLPNGLHLLRVEMAAQKLGVITVPIISGQTYQEIAYILAHAEPSHLIVDSVGARTISDGGGLSGDTGISMFVVGDAAGLGTLESGDVTPPPRFDADPMDGMSIRYTSGSTGRPKGVIQPSCGFATAGRAIAARLRLAPEDNMFCALPLFHTAAFHMMLGPAIAVGCRFTLVPQFSRTAFWSRVREVGGTHTLLMPAQVSILLTEPVREDDADNPLRVIFTHVRSAEACERFDVDICTTWAMTETSGMGTLSPPGYDSYPAKMIGWPMPDEAEGKIVGPDGARLPAGEVGEFCFRHPHVMTGYYKDPENTGKTLRDGWVHSGDLGAMDDAGRVYFHGRLKNVIKRAGENIAGEEVEFTLMNHPAIEESVVCGIEDAIYTEEVCATVVVRSGQRLTEQDVVRWCTEHLSTWKAPRYVHLRHETLPKLANGKTDRTAVIAAARAEIASAWDATKERADA